MDVAGQGLSQTFFTFALPTELQNPKVKAGLEPAT